MPIESGSSLGVFCDCPKKYEFAYEKMLTPKGYSSALGYGTFVHSFIEQFTGGREDAAITELASMLSRIETRHHAQIHLDYSLAGDVFLLWRQRWGGDHPFNSDNFEWVASEKEWVTKVLDDKHLLAGKSDGIIREKSTKALFYYELKTAADRDREGYVHKLEIDKQVSNNLLALRNEGIEVVGVFYDIIWKPALRLKTGRKTMQDETGEELNFRIVEEIKKNPDEFFQRQMIYRSDRFLNSSVLDLELQFKALDTARATGGFYRNTGNCDKWNRLCEFFSTCIENRQELEDLYSVRDRKLPELSLETQAPSKETNVNP